MSFQAQVIHEPFQKNRPQALYFVLASGHWNCYRMAGCLCAGTINELAAWILVLSVFLPVIMLQVLNQLIECHGDRTQDDDGCDHHVELEEKESGSDKTGYA